MAQNLELLALVSGLLTNWDSIRLRLEPISPTFTAQLNDLARRFQDSDSSDEIANLIDDLLDLTRDTSAFSYVQSLVERAQVGEMATLRDDESPAGPSTGGVPPAPGEDAAKLSLDNSRILGTLISVESEIARVPIFYATNRAKAATGETQFSGELATENSYGVVEVTIPVNKHRIGQVATPHWWTLFPNVNKSKRFVLLDKSESLTPSTFGTRLETSLRNADSKDLLIFLHGYCVTFEEAARKAAQIAYDMQFPGAVVLFSWPSRGATKAYPTDEECAISSADPFARFLKNLEGGPWNRVHVVAHSMGNRVMLLGLADNPRPQLPLGHVVFAAADVFVQLFQEKFSKLQEAGRFPATSYASKHDLPLRISRFFHRVNRVGLITDQPFVVPQLETIDASAVGTGILGHSYFADKRSVIFDLKWLLHDSSPPQTRGLRAVGNYWLFPE